jgi:membrane associated rhomboid family serine protease
MVCAFQCLWRCHPAVLILPLHHPLDVRHLPWATFGLLLLNLFVFIVLQSGDPAREAYARQRYVESGLAALEVEAWLASPSQNLSARMQAYVEMLRAAPEPVRSSQLSELIDLDPAFLRALPSTVSDPSAWRALRDAHEAELSRSFTWRYQIQSESLDPARLLGSAFLHGSVGHLIGNMLFLLLIGMLVEGAIGARLMVLLYVLGAIGSSLAALAWNWGEPHAGLGASGAVAALMGAYCWIWGLRPVRFFYWFFVVFDYVRAPALLLFPVWLGWELWNLLMHPDAGIGFDAHAGGLLTGAAFGLTVSRLGWVREDFIELSDSSSRERASALLDAAEQQIGRLDLAQAEASLDALAEEDEALAASARARIARYRIARFGARLPQAGAILSELLVQPGLDLGSHLGLLKEAASGSPRVSAEAFAAGFERQLQAGRFEALHALLRDLPLDLHSALQPRLWFKLALAERQGGAGGDPRGTLRELMKRFPQSPEAAKARVLLG